jgi:hypothetical protein
MEQRQIRHAVAAAVGSPNISGICHPTLTSGIVDHQNHTFRRSTMLRTEEWMDIKMLKQQGHSIRKICELTGHSRNTVRKVLHEKSPQAFNKPERKSLLDEFKPYVEQRYQQCALSCVRLIEEICK